MARNGPFWSRTKVGVSAGIVGIIIGSGFGTDEPVEAPAAADPPAAEVAAPEDTSEQDIAAAVDDATGELEDQLAEEDAAHAKELKVVAKQAVKTQRAAISAAVTKAVAQAVTKTRAEEQAKAESQVQTFTSTPSAPATDPQYGTCGEANDNGYGSYVSGQDPEYAWYDDRDNDGVVCEF